MKDPTIDFLVAVLRSVHDLEEQMAVMAASVSGLIEAVDERFPNFSDRYEHHRAASEKTSPIVAQCRARSASLRRLIERVDQKNADPS